MNVVRGSLSSRTPNEEHSLLVLEQQHRAMLDPRQKPRFSRSLIPYRLYITQGVSRFSLFEKAWKDFANFDGVLPISLLQKD
jgi:hypothetical protein